MRKDLWTGFLVFVVSAVWAFAERGDSRCEMIPTGLLLFSVGIGSSVFTWNRTLEAPAGEGSFQADSLVMHFVSAWMGLIVFGALSVGGWTIGSMVAQVFIGLSPDRHCPVKVDAHWHGQVQDLIKSLREDQLDEDQLLLFWSLVR